MIRQSGLKLGVDPMGGTALAVAGVGDGCLEYHCGNSSQDPEFVSFMPPDHDGRFAAGLPALHGEFTEDS